MAAHQVRLTAASPQQSVNVQFQPSHIAVDNPTASPIFIRIGAPMIPTETDADTYVPAGASKSIPVRTITRDFGIAFGNPASLTTESESGLFRTAIVTFLSADENIPAYGSSSFLTLSISDLTGGFLPFSNPSTSSALFDISAWGGAVIHVSPDPSPAGQGVVTIWVSDGTTSKLFQILAFWPGIPITINLPRVARFFQIHMLNAGIPAQPPISGIYSVRATLEEITEFTYQITGTVLSNAYNVPNISESSWVVATYGLPSISIALRNTAGAGLYGQIIVETSTGAAGPWTFVTTREQNISPGSLGASMYRTLGTLGPYTRIRLLNNGAAGPLIGTIEFSIQPVQDLAGVLSDIYRTLGDVSQPVSVNQSLFSLMTNYLPYLATIDLDTGNILSQLVTISAQLSTVNGQLIAIDGHVDGLEALITSTNALITSTNAKLDTLIAQPNFPSILFTGGFAVPAAAFANLGAVLTPGSYLSSLSIGYQIQGALPDGYIIQFAYGTAGAVVAGFHTITGVQPEGYASRDFYGTKAGGLLVPAGMTNLWVFASVATFVAYTIISRSA